MKQFNLSEWLKDKSRKVMTRRGNPVRIICTDRKHGEDDLPIVFLEESNGGEFLLTCKSNGRDGSSKDYDTQYDLFFADEENTELTEFEKTMIQFSHERNSLILFEHTAEEINAHLYLYYKKLLDLARKELEENYYTKVLDDGMVFKSKLHATDLQTAYDMGKQDALKDLPKWKKATKCKEFDKHVCVMDYHTFPFLDTEVNEGDYYIKLEDLKNLPKEE